MAPRETGNNAYAKFWGDKQRALWYVMVFSGVVKRAFSLTWPASMQIYGTKESVYIRKEFNSQRIVLVHQHGRRFIVLEHQYGRRDVM